VTRRSIDPNGDSSVSVGASISTSTSGSRSPRPELPSGPGSVGLPAVASGALVVNRGTLDTPPPGRYQPRPRTGT
jgi:hypothetical protein